MPVDWMRVHQACRRGKEGRLRPGDQELLDHAFRTDPAKYREVHRKAAAEVVAETRMMRWPR
jgi:hypothetical protein